MSKFNKLILKYVKAYETSSGVRWKAAVPDGFGEKIRKQGFLSQKDGILWAENRFIESLSKNKRVLSNSGSITFSEYANHWLETKLRNGLAPASSMSYAADIRLKLNPYFGGFKLNRLEKFHLANFIRDSQEAKESAAALKKSVSLFKAIIKQAEIDDLLPLTGIRTLPTPKSKKTPPKFWDKSEMNYFMNASVSNLNHDLWKFTLWTGMRAGRSGWTQMGLRTPR